MCTGSNAVRALKPNESLSASQLARLEMPAGEAAERTKAVSGPSVNNPCKAGQRGDQQRAP